LVARTMQISPSQVRQLRDLRAYELVQAPHSHGCGN
jgi:hypothetical protein